MYIVYVLDIVVINKEGEGLYNRARLQMKMCQMC